MVKYKDDKAKGKGEIKASRTIINKVVNDKVALLTTDAMADTRLEQAQSLFSQKIRSAMCVPLWKKDEVIGVIQLDSVRFNNQFTEDDLELLKAIGHQMAMVIEQASLNEQIREEERLILLIISSLFFYFNKSLTKRILEKYIADKAGAKLEIGKLDYDLFPLSVQADSVKVFQEIRGMEIDIFLNQLSIEGEINRLLKKQKPTLSSIEISGAVFHIFQGEEEEEMEVDFQENMLLLSDLFSYAARINFKDFSFKYIAPSNSVNFERGSFFLSGSDKKGEFNYSISGEKALISNMDRKVSFESSLSSSGKFSLIDMPYFEGEILLESINFTQIEEKILLSEISLRLKSEFCLDEKMLVFPQFEMNVPPFFDASGYLKAGLGEDFSLLSLSKVHLKDLNKTHVFLKPYLMPYLPPQLKNLALEGGVYLKGEYQYIKNSSRANLSGTSIMWTGVKILFVPMCLVSMIFL